MAKRHLFSLNAPVNWPISRKENKWVARPNPGPHQLRRSLPLSLFLKGILNYATTLREVRRILMNNEVMVNKKVRKDYKFPVGLMDNIEIKSKNEHFRLFINSDNKYEFKKLKKEEAKEKLCKIINKQILKKGKIQLNLYDGRNILVDNHGYKTGDTIIVDLDANKIISHIKLEKGATAYLIGGKYIGNIGKIESIKERKGLQPAKVVVNTKDKKFETLKDYVFVINKDSLKVENE